MADYDYVLSLTDSVCLIGADFAGDDILLYNDPNDPAETIQLILQNFHQADGERCVFAKTVTLLGSIAELVVMKPSYVECDRDRLQNFKQILISDIDPSMPAIASLLPEAATAETKEAEQPATEIELARYPQDLQKFLARHAAGSKAGEAEIVKTVKATYHFLQRENCPIPELFNQLLAEEYIYNPRLLNYVADKNFELYAIGILCNQYTKHGFKLASQTFAYCLDKLNANEEVTGQTNAIIINRASAAIVAKAASGEEFIPEVALIAGMLGKHHDQVTLMHLYVTLAKSMERDIAAKTINSEVVSIIEAANQEQFHDFAIISLHKLALAGYCEFSLETIEQVAVSAATISNVTLKTFAYQFLREVAKHDKYAQLLQAGVVHLLAVDTNDETLLNYALEIAAITAIKTAAYQQELLTKLLAIGSNSKLSSPTKIKALEVIAKLPEVARELINNLTNDDITIITKTLEIFAAKAIAEPEFHDEVIIYIERMIEPALVRLDLQQAIVRYLTLLLTEGRQFPEIINNFLHLVMQNPGLYSDQQQTILANYLSAGVPVAADYEGSVTEDTSELVGAATEFKREKEPAELLAEIEQINGLDNIVFKLATSGELTRHYQEVLKAETEDSKILPQGSAITDWNEQQVGAWASHVAEHGADLTEIIAVVKHGNKLVTGNDPRAVQIFALLSLLSATNNGLILQIATGEGKTTISSMLAAIKALLGETVDIVTSSAVLAERDSKERAEFYALFNLTVSHNGDKEENKGYKSGPKPCYSADIVYGDASNFQYDLLRHEFAKQQTRGERTFGTVIVDEVDSMLIDESAKIAMLSSPVAGAEFLEPLYAAIWYRLNKINDQFYYKDDQLIFTDGEFENVDGELRLVPGTETIQLVDDIDKFKQKYLECYIMMLIENGEFKLPNHLHHFALMQAKEWVKMALLAQKMELDKHYIITNDQYGNGSITPVDYSNTGVINLGSNWSDGLQQFLQIKHALKLHGETLTTNFISNMGFFKLYGHKIFGMTGTLGSEDSQALLHEVYSVDLGFIPTYKQKSFNEQPLQITDSQEQWSGSILTSVQAELAKNRACLLICKTIKDAKEIAALLRDRHAASNIRLYTRSDNDEKLVIDKVIDTGEVIIATNLAGRGTDIKTTARLEQHGGMHVIICFLPDNLRVEQQAFGRTSRQGASGSGEIIVNKEVENVVLQLDVSGDTPAQLVKALRNEYETARLAEVKLDKMPELVVGDELFQALCNLFGQLRSIEDNKTKLSQVEELWGYVLKEIKHSWQDYKEEQLAQRNNSRLTSSEAAEYNKHKRIFAFSKFNEFKAYVLLNYQNGSVIYSNPAHLVLAGFNLMGNHNSYLHSIELLEIAANLDNNYALAARYNKSYALINQGSMDCHRKGKIIPGYMSDAYSELMQSAMIIQETLLPLLDTTTLLAAPAKDTELTRQMAAKAQLLKLQLEYIEKTCEKIRNCPGGKFIEIEERKRLQEFYDDDDRPETEINELNNYGVLLLYDVKYASPPKDIAMAVFVGVLGIAECMLGVCAAMIGQFSLAASLIMEGVNDLLAANNIAEGKLTAADYLTQKGISIAVAFASAKVSNLFAKDVTKGATKELARGATKQVTTEVTKEVSKLTAKEIIQGTVTEIGKKLAVNKALENIAGFIGKDLLEGHNHSIDKEIHRALEAIFSDGNICAKFNYLAMLDMINNNPNYLNQVIKAGQRAIIVKKSILDQIGQGIVNNIATSSMVSTGAKVAAIGVNVASSAYHLEKLSRAAEEVAGEVVAKINQLAGTPADLTTILYNSLSRKVSHEELRLIIELYTEQGLIVDGRFTDGLPARIKTIDISTIYKQKHNYALIYDKCIRMYEAQNQDYNSQYQRLIERIEQGLNNQVSQQMRRHVVRPLFNTPIANFVADMVEPLVTSISAVGFGLLDKRNSSLQQVAESVIIPERQYIQSISGVSAGDGAGADARAKASNKGKEPAAVAEVDYDSDDDGGWNLTNPAWYDEQGELLDPQDRPQRPYIPTDDGPMIIIQNPASSSASIPGPEYYFTADGGVAMPGVYVDNSRLGQAIAQASSNKPTKIYDVSKSGSRASAFEDIDYYSALAEGRGTPILLTDEQKQQYNEARINLSLASNAYASTVQVGFNPTTINLPALEFSVVMGARFLPRVLPPLAPVAALASVAASTINYNLNAPETSYRPAYTGNPLIDGAHTGLFANPIDQMRFDGLEVTSTVATVATSNADDETGICKVSHVYSEYEPNSKRVSAKQKFLLQGVEIYGINPGNIRPDKGIISVDTELFGGELAARECFKNLTGVAVPLVVGPRGFKEARADGALVVFRPLGDSGHPKVEINARSTTRIHEKITFKD